MNIRTEIAGIIDHTYLKADADKEKIRRLCQEALQYNFYSVCIPPCFVEFAYGYLKSHNKTICTVIGFPLGFSAQQTKIFEAKKAVVDGADELDIVLNIGLLKEGSLTAVSKEIRDIINSIPSDITTKIIIETAFLNKEEIESAAKIILSTKADFIKTSTGYASSGATVEDVTHIKHIIGNNIKIKAAGGIRSLEFAEKLVKAGASRIGCSNSIDLIT